MRRSARALTLLLCSLAALTPAVSAQAPDRAATPMETFWQSLQALCGRAFEGRVTESIPPYTLMQRATLTMQVRECSADSIRIPFHVGANRSRTWVVSRTGTGLRLKHDHRHEDGSEDAVTQSGGDTRAATGAARQEFHADAHTASLLPAAATNVWTIEIVPGHRFVYALRREGTERRFRAEFDLTRPVPAPPPPWGAR